MPYIILILLSLCISTSIMAQPTESKKQLSGLKRLMAGNQRYVQDALEHPNRNAERREAIMCKQEPFAIIVGCADSRVSPEIIFDQGVGDLFVVRVAGNVIGPLELESIQYGVLALNATTIVVLGHESCGAVSAVNQNSIKGIESIAALIYPAVEQAKATKAPNLLESSIKINAINMKNYLQRIPALQASLKNKNLQIYAGYYRLETGAVEILKKP